MIDTTSPHGKLILAVLGALAEFERAMILARTSEGRRRAQDRGVRFGRKPKLTPHQIAEALARKANGEALTDIGRSFNVSHAERPFSFPPSTNWEELRGSRFSACFRRSSSSNSPSEKPPTFSSGLAACFTGTSGRLGNLGS